MIVINPIMGGKKLPALTNPATAAQILKGYQAIDGEGQAMTGTMEKGYKFATGTFIAPLFNKTKTVNVGFKPAYIVMKSFVNYSDGDRRYLLFYDTGSPNSNYEIDIDNMGDGHKSLSDYWITSISSMGFTFTTHDSGVSSETVTYYIFGQ